MEKLSTEDLKKKIELCKLVHNNKYSYDKVIYVNFNTKVIITCPIHGDFEQNLYDHSVGRGCNICRSEKMKICNLKGREDFIKKSNITHKNKYTYDKVPNNFGVRQKVIITCPIHGDFNQTADSHKRGRGCPYCKGKSGQDLNKSNQLKKDRINHFIKKYQFEHVRLIESYSKGTMVNKFYCDIHGEFSKNSSQVSKGQICGECLKLKNRKVSVANELNKMLKRHNNKFEYINYIDLVDEITVKCIEHNHTFKILKSSHVQNKYGGCGYCISQYKDFRMKEQDEVIKNFRNVHEDRYRYDNVDYRGRSIKVSITCLKHGDFMQTPSSHLNGSGCPNCKSSSGEKMIQGILKKMGISYVTEKRFFGCSSELGNKLLPFDIYVPEFHTCIEFDGYHHFFPIEAWGGENSLIKVQNRDRYKNEYCEKNEIDLIRIPYTMSKLDIVDLLNKKFNKNIVINIKKRIKWIDSNIKDIVSQYKTRKEFFEKNKSLYTYCYRNKLMDYVCDSMERKGSVPFTFETAKKIAETYNDYTLFEKERGGLIAYIRKNNLGYLTSHMVRKKRYLTDDMIFEEIKKYKNKSDLRKKDPNLYELILRRGHKDKINNSIISWNEEKVINAFKNCSSKKELVKKYRGAENWAVKRGLYHEYIKLYLGKNNP
jgi:hypothetical protein